ncbi:unnamed protein product [Arabis nemorensis]|uniref:Uncharacterized protein n=1 Tax=Arabis nemorensis TaxID=586526 RepID=A0A565B9W1_9BRAS|nr:unnamed protein product [Arabis nemorensis]
MKFPTKHKWRSRLLQSFSELKQKVVWELTWVLDLRNLYLLRIGVKIKNRRYNFKAINEWVVSKAEGTLREAFEFAGGLFKNQEWQAPCVKSLEKCDKWRFVSNE